LNTLQSDTNISAFGQFGKQKSDKLRNSTPNFGSKSRDTISIDESIILDDEIEMYSEGEGEDDCEEDEEETMDDFIEETTNDEMDIQLGKIPQNRKIRLIGQKKYY
jgi:hypothetical protein